MSKTRKRDICSKWHFLTFDLAFGKSFPRALHSKFSFSRLHLSLYFEEEEYSIFFGTWVGKNKHSEVCLTDTITCSLLSTELSHSKWMVYFDLEYTRTRILAREQNEKCPTRSGADCLLGKTMAFRWHDQEWHIIIYASKTLLIKKHSALLALFSERLYAFFR